MKNQDISGEILISKSYQKYVETQSYTAYIQKEKKEVQKFSKFV